MSKFSKFLKNKEDLIFYFVAIYKGHGKYVTIMFLLLLFFLLYPMWQFGRQGLGIWMVAVIFLFIILIKQLIGKERAYLFTTQRLIMLEKSGYDYKIKGSIKHSHIDKIHKQGKMGIILYSSNHAYHLSSIVNRDKVVYKIKAYLQL